LGTDKSGVKKKIGLLGGTLDPIHYGHLRAGEEVYETLGLDEVWFVPAFQPPHKLNKPLTPFLHRLKMAELATDAIDHFKAKDLEAKRPGASYSVDLLRQIHSLYDNTLELYFILGTDAAIEIDSWKQWQELPSLASLVIIKRAPVSLEDVGRHLQNLYPHIHISHGETDSENRAKVILLDTTALEISSTDIRKRIGQQKSVRFLLPETVRKYIMENKLYLEDFEKQMEQREATGPMEGIEGISAAEHIYNQIHDNKGEKIVVLDMRSTSPVADFFIIAQGRSTRHVQGMANRMKRELSRKKIKCRNIEGEEEGKWVLMDFDDVVVHLFYEPIRAFYDLEGLWNEAPRLIMTTQGLKQEKEDDQK